MTHLAICEDNRQDMDAIVQLLGEYRDSFPEPDLAVSCFTDSEDLLNQIRSGKRYAIYFLDVMLPGESGITLAKEIRLASPEAIIIFVTASKEYALDAFGVLAQRYLLKPVQRTHFFEALNFALKQTRQKGIKIFPLKTSEGIASIPFKNILYVECASRVIHLHCINGVVLSSVFIRKNFEFEISALLDDPSFIQTHKSFAVNMEHVRQLKTHSFVMNEGTEIAIARKRQVEVKRRYLQFLSEYGTI